MVHPVVTVCGELGIVVVVVVVFLSWTLWGSPSICNCPLINALSAFHYVRGVWLVLLPGYMHSHMPSSEESGHWVPESLSQLQLGHWVFRIIESVASWALSVQNHWVSYICGIECSESLSQLCVWHWVFRITDSVVCVAVCRTQQGGSIKRANKNDGSGVTVLKSNVSNLLDIKVFLSNRQTGAQCVYKYSTLSFKILDPHDTDQK